MATRYIPSDLDEVKQKSDPMKELVNSLEKIVTEYPPKDSYDSYECHGLYSGPTSIAFLFLQIARTHRQLNILSKDCESWAKAYLSGKRDFLFASVNKNGVGSETLAFHAINMDTVKLLPWMKYVYEIHEGGSDEWLYGRAGCLYLLRWVRQWGSEVSVNFVEPIIPRLVDAILDHGPSWPWHGKDYLGAVHGRIGIITQVILTDPSKVFHPTILASLHEVLDLQLEDGNWPSSIYSTHHDLVQFCHGAPGFLFALKAIEPFISSVDPSLETRIRSAIEKAEKCVADKGILTKQPNLCHGTSGNALALPSPLREKMMSYTTQEAVRNGLEQGHLIQGDDPYGMFCGEAGRAWAWSVLAAGKDEGMIGFSDV